MPRLTGLSPRDMPTDFASLVRRHPPTAIHDKVAYENALEVIGLLSMLPDPTDGQARYVDTLAILVEAYEREHLPFDTSRVRPLDVLRHLMESHGMSASDLGRLLGERSLGSKILAGGRQLSKAHVRVLAEHFGVSASLFL